MTLSEYTAASESPVPTKETPLEYGEYLLGIYESEEITQAQLSEKVGQNRSTLSHYLKMARWSAELKTWIRASSDVLTNTDILRAARTCADEEAVFVLLEGVSEKRADKQYRGGASRKAKPEPALTSEVCNTRDVVAKLGNNAALVAEVESNKKALRDERETVVALADELKCNKMALLAERRRSLQVAEELDKKQAELSSVALKVAELEEELKGAQDAVDQDILPTDRDWRLTAISYTFWLLVIPVTVSFTRSVLASFSFPDYDILLGIGTTDLAAVALSLAVDGLIFILLGVRGRWWTAGAAVMLIAGNCLGAYWVADKAADRPGQEARAAQTAQLNERLREAKKQRSDAKGNYLAIKWKGSADAEGCEEGTSRTKCYGPYRTLGLEAQGKYLSAVSMVKDLESEASKRPPLESTRTHDSADIWFHLGYYILIWALILVTKALDNLRREQAPSLL